MPLLLLGLGTAVVLSLIEELSPYLLPSWLKVLVGTALGVGGSYEWFGNLSFRHALVGVAAVYVAGVANRFLGYLVAAGDEKTTAIVARRYARRGPML